MVVETRDILIKKGVPAFAGMTIEELWKI